MGATGHVIPCPISPTAVIRYIVGMTPNSPTFTREQTAVIEHGAGHALVSAVAGSGKSTTMVERVAYLLRHDVDPNRILVIQYNKQAQLTMTRKLADGLPGSTVPKAKTFHSLGLDMRKTLVQAGALKPAKLLKGNKAAAVYRRALRTAWQLANGKSSFPPEDVSKHFEEFVTLVKADTRPARLVYQDLDYSLECAVYVRAFDILREITLDEQTMFYDDMLYDPFVAMSEDPSLWRKFAGQHQHIIVDEFQDANSIQFWLMMGRAGLIPFQVEDPDNPGAMIDARVPVAQCMVVGDGDQSIYGFRGANVRLINSEFERSFTPCTRYPMTRTFRYGHETALLANQIITRNLDRDDKITVAASGNPDTRIHFRYHAPTEPTGLVKAVSKAYEQQRLHRGAMLVRFYSMSVPYEIELTEAGIPYHVYGREPLLCIPEIASMVGALFLATDYWTVLDDEREMFLRAMLTVPNLYLTAEMTFTLSEALAQASLAGSSLHQVLTKFAGSIASTDARKASMIRERASTFYVLESGSLKNSKPKDILRSYLDSTGFSDTLRAMAMRSDADEMVRNVKAFVEMAGRYESSIDLLEMLGPLAGRKEDDPPDCDHLAILSIHKSKGEEWPTVFLPSWVEGAFPRTREGIEEERRLAYVAVTRAISNLVFLLPKDEVFADFIQKLDVPPPQKDVRASTFLMEGEPGIALKIGDVIRNRQVARIACRYSNIAQRYIDAAGITGIEVHTPKTLADQLKSTQNLKDVDLTPGQIIIHSQNLQDFQYRVVRKWSPGTYQVESCHDRTPMVMNVEDPGWRLQPP